MGERRNDKKEFFPPFPTITTPQSPKHIWWDIPKEEKNVRRCPETSTPIGNEINQKCLSSLTLVKNSSPFFFCRREKERERFSHPNHAQRLESLVIIIHFRACGKPPAKSRWRGNFDCCGPQFKGERNPQVNLTIDTDQFRTTGDFWNGGKKKRRNTKRAMSRDTWPACYGFVSLWEIWKEKSHKVSKREAPSLLSFHFRTAHRIERLLLRWVRMTRHCCDVFHICCGNKHGEAADNRSGKKGVDDASSKQDDGIKCCAWGMAPRTTCIYGNGRNNRATHHTLPDG